MMALNINHVTVENDKTDVYTFKGIKSVQITQLCVKVCSSLS